MMKSLNKKAKTIIIAAFAAVLFVSAAVAFILNYHNIYAFALKNGWFCTPVAVENADDTDLQEYSLNELLSDSRVSFDQSLMLVNTTYLLPEDFIPDVVEYKDTTVFMSRPMIDAYAQLSGAVKELTGNKLYVSSDLRTREEQEALYREDPATATIPGASEHQSGLALDVYVAYYAGDAFLKSPSGRFVNTHAHEYGFIIRYPSYGEEITGIRYEPWHIRYVGAPHAGVIYNNQLTLEEYILSFEIGEWYEIDGYLVSRQTMGGNITMPEDFTSCTISPDNTGCYIITVKK
ncbi:MAG: M15 family metallopeptidase [Clostridia bacterium]|nr:M15 family metallopeptidase [Clostridia bacterium]